MHTLLLLILVGLVGSATAKQCRNITVPVQIEARQGIFNVPTITSNEDVTTWVQSFTSIANGTNFPMESLLGYQNVTGAYEICAKFCTPDVMNGMKPVVQVLTHGIGFDKSYWDLPYNDFNYSYIDVMVDTYGYCTLSFDRFGIGNSSHADGIDVVQAPAEISALHNLNLMLRAGTFPTVEHAFNESGTIVNVGHSFGSQQSYELSMMYPNITDAIVLTGFSFNGSYFPQTLTSFQSEIARFNQPMRFGSTNAAVAIDAVRRFAREKRITLADIAGLLVQLNLTDYIITDDYRSTTIFDLLAGVDTNPAQIPQNLDNTYLTWNGVWANQYNFLYPAGIDPAILYYSEANKQPFTFGELLTLGGVPAVSPFTGPVHIVTGNQDSIYCGGDCMNTGLPDVASIPAAAAILFPNASNFSVYITPDTGHGLNMHYNAKLAYHEIAAYLAGVGIVPS